MSSPIYPSFKDLFKACFFPRPFSLPEHYGIHTYKMLCSECLSKTAGLTKRTLYSVSSAPLSFFFLFILTCERAVPHQDGNIDFSGQTVDTTFGENSPIPSYKGHIDLHLSSWPPRFVQSHWGFLWGGPSSQIAHKTPMAEIVVLTQLYSPALAPGTEVSQTPFTEYKAIFYFHSSLKKSIFLVVPILPTDGCQWLPHLLSNCKWPISYLWEPEFCKGT